MHWIDKYWKLNAVFDAVLLPPGNPSRALWTFELKDMAVLSRGRPPFRVEQECGPTPEQAVEACWRIAVQDRARDDVLVSKVQQMASKPLPRTTSSIFRVERDASHRATSLKFECIFEHWDQEKAEKMTERAFAERARAAEESRHAGAHNEGSSYTHEKLAKLSEENHSAKQKLQSLESHAANYKAEYSADFGAPSNAFFKEGAGVRQIREHMCQGRRGVPDDDFRQVLARTFGAHMAIMMSTGEDLDRVAYVFDKVAQYGRVRVKPWVARVYEMLCRLDRVTMLEHPQEAVNHMKRSIADTFDLVEEKMRGL
jgi:hypothetical protein